MDGEDMWTIIVAIVVIAALFIGMFSGIFVDQKIAVETLEKQGFSEVKIIEKQWFVVGWRGCASGDAARFTASAVNPRNQTVELYVCVGWPFKGATIRNG